MMMMDRALLDTREKIKFYSDIIHVCTTTDGQFKSMQVFIEAATLSLPNLFTDLSDSDRGVRCLATKCICALACNHIENQKLLLQENGLTVGYLRIFALPKLYSTAYQKACLKNQKEGSSLGLRLFLEEEIWQKSAVVQVQYCAKQRNNEDETTTPLCWSSEDNCLLLDPKMHLIGFYLVSKKNYNDDLNCPILQMQNAIMKCSRREQEAMLGMKDVFERAKKFKHPATDEDGVLKRHLVDLLTDAKRSHVAVNEMVLPILFSTAKAHLLVASPGTTISWHTFAHNCLLFLFQKTVEMRWGEETLTYLLRAFQHVLKTSKLPCADATTLASALLYAHVQHHPAKHGPLPQEVLGILYSTLLPGATDWFEEPDAFHTRFRIDEPRAFLRYCYLGTELNWLTFLTALQPHVKEREKLFGKSFRKLNQKEKSMKKVQGKRFHIPTRQEASLKMKSSAKEYRARAVAKAQQELIELDRTRHLFKTDSSRETFYAQREVLCAALLAKSRDMAEIDPMLVPKIADVERLTATFLQKKETAEVVRKTKHLKNLKEMEATSRFRKERLVQEESQRAKNAEERHVRLEEQAQVTQQLRREKQSFILAKQESIQKTRENKQLEKEKEIRKHWKEEGQRMSTRLQEASARYEQQTSQEQQAIKRPIPPPKSPTYYESRSFRARPHSARVRGKVFGEIITRQNSPLKKTFTKPVKDSISKPKRTLSSTSSSRYVLSTSRNRKGFQTLQEKDSLNQLHSTSQEMMSKQGGVPDVNVQYDQLSSKDHLTFMNRFPKRKMSRRVTQECKSHFVDQAKKKMAWQSFCKYVVGSSSMSCDLPPTEKISKSGDSFSIHRSYFMEAVLNSNQLMRSRNMRVEHYERIARKLDPHSTGLKWEVFYKWLQDEEEAGAIPVQEMRRLGRMHLKTS